MPTLSQASKAALSKHSERPQEKRSAYAPTTDEPVRYDGIYRIASCWRKAGAQGKLMCRYLFMRCDSEPAPWASDGEHSSFAITKAVTRFR